MFDKAGSQGGGRAGASPTFLANKFTATVVVFLLCEGIGGSEKIGPSENQTTIRQDIVARGLHAVFTPTFSYRAQPVGCLRILECLKKAGLASGCGYLSNVRGGHHARQARAEPADEDGHIDAGEREGWGVVHDFRTPAPRGKTAGCNSNFSSLAHSR